MFAAAASNIAGTGDLLAHQWTDAVRRYAPDARIIASGGHDWNADPFSKGTWFAPPVGWRAITAGEDLESPVGRLAFAGGDLPDVGGGWIEGAIASGGRAAERVAAMLEVDVPA